MKNLTKLSKGNYYLISENYKSSLIYVNMINIKKDKIKITYLNYYGRYWKMIYSISLAEFVKDMQFCIRIAQKKEKDADILEAIKDKKIKEKQKFPNEGTKRWYQLTQKKQQKHPYSNITK